MVFCYTEIMRLNFLQFFQTAANDFIEASLNVMSFLPYFFSTVPLFKSLFSPWKNLIVKKKREGFSLGEWLNRQSFNAISRIIGFFMRFSIISFYFVFTFLLIIMFPLITILYFLLIPISYIVYLFQVPEDVRKKILKEEFISTHLMREENRSLVDQWFETLYQKKYRKQRWWKISALYSYPPVARDWAVGFTPILDQYTTDLTAADYQNKMKNVIDRQQEIDEIERVLAKSGEASVVIVGDEGVGKHTIVDALAKKLYEGKTVHTLLYKRVLKLNMEKMLNEVVEQKQRENFFENLISEAAEAKNVILFIDDLDRYISGGEGRVDLAAAIEKYTRSNAISIIGITTPFFYEKFFVSNERINRFFNKINVGEVNQSSAKEILLNSVFIFEQRYDVCIPYEAIEYIIEKSNYYITHIPFPEKAIDLLDSACVYAQKNHHPIVNPQYVDVVISEKMHIPTVLTDKLKEKLIKLESLLNNSVIQQKEAISQLTSAIQRSFLLIGLRKKPLATFLFAGPTGVGKTATAKMLAEIFFGSEKYLVRFDMSLYQSKSDISKLIGSLESGNPGMLTSSIREQPYGVLLLDEIEKADHDLINIFLTILDEGYFTDGYGKKVDCKNLVIIATTNAANIDQAFSPEFLNRLDGVITFQPLTTATVIIIAQKIIAKIKEEIYKLYKVRLSVSDRYLREMTDKSYDIRYGARNMERLIREEVESKIAKLLLAKKVGIGESIEL